MSLVFPIGSRNNLTNTQEHEQLNRQTRRSKDRQAYGGKINTENRETHSRTPYYLPTLPTPSQLDRQTDKGIVMHSVAHLVFYSLLLVVL